MAIDTNEIMIAALADWGETVTIGGVSVTAMFDEPFASASPFGLGVESSGPMLLCKTADLPGDTDHGTAVVVRGTAYTVSGRKDDGMGGSELPLRQS
jgi:hypothetical protein